MRSRTFRIFVSSTFSDLELERNALQNIVFPELRKFCREHNAEFEAVDLRWGVSEEFGLKNRTMDICLEELRRCQEISPRPNFIILLGNRYGWRPLPIRIAQDDFLKIEPHLSDKEKELFHLWYFLDENNLPPVYLIKERSEEWVENNKWTKEVENLLRAALFEAGKTAGLTEAGLNKFSFSATHQEIIEGALQSENSSEHVFCYLREFNNLPLNQKTAKFFDQEKSRFGRYTRNPEAAALLENLKSELKNKIPQENIFSTDIHWKKYKNSKFQDYCGWLIEKLKLVITNEISELDRVNEIQREINLQEAYCQSVCQQFFGYEKELKNLLSSLSVLTPGSNKNLRPVVIWGDPGSGKSSIAAAFLQTAPNDNGFFKKWMDVGRYGRGMKTRGVHFLYRFVGSSPNSSTGYALLKSLHFQYRGKQQKSADPDMRKVCSEFKKMFSNPRVHRNISDNEIAGDVILIDGLDHLPEDDPIWENDWLPDKWLRKSGPRILYQDWDIRLVLTTSDGRVKKYLEEKLPDALFIHLDYKKNIPTTELFNHWLKKTKRTLQPDQKTVLFLKFSQNPLPQYMRLVFESIKDLPSNEKILPESIPDDTSPFQNHILSGIEKEHGRTLLKYTLLYLGAANLGLSEGELRDLLSRQKEVMQEFREKYPWSPPVDKLPNIVWSRLYLDLEKFLVTLPVQNGTVLTFKNRRFKETIKQSSPVPETKEIISAMAEYFWEQPARLNYRRVEELPHLLEQLKDDNRLMGLYSEMRFLHAAFEIKGLNGLLQELNRTVELNFLSLKDKNTLHLIRRGLQVAASVLIPRPEQFPYEVQSRLLAYAHPQNRDNTHFNFDCIQKLVKTNWDYPLRIIQTNQEAAGEQMKIHFGNFAPNKHFPIFFEDGKKIAFLSSNQIKAYDIQQMEELWSTQVSSLRSRIHSSPQHDTARENIYLNKQKHAHQRLEKTEIIKINLEDGVKTELLGFDKQKLDCFDFSDDGKALACICYTPQKFDVLSTDFNKCYEKELRIYDFSKNIDTETAELLFSFNLDPEKSIATLKFLPGRKEFLSVDIEQLILWNSISGKQLQIWKISKEPFSNIKENNKLLGTVRIKITSDEKYAFILIAWQLFRINLQDAGQKIEHIHFPNVLQYITIPFAQIDWFEVNPSTQEIYIFVDKTVQKLDWSSLKHNGIYYLPVTERSGRFALDPHDQWAAVYFTNSPKECEKLFQVIENDSFSSKIPAKYHQNNTGVSNLIQIFNQPGKDSFLSIDKHSVYLHACKNGEIITSSRITPNDYLIYSVLLSPDGKNLYVLFAPPKGKTPLLQKFSLSFSENQMILKKIRQSSPPAAGKIIWSLNHEEVMLVLFNSVYYFDPENLNPSGESIIRKTGSEVPRFNGKPSQRATSRPPRKEYRDLTWKNRKIITDPNLFYSQDHQYIAESKEVKLKFSLILKYAQEPNEQIAVLNVKHKIENVIFSGNPHYFFALDSKNTMHLLKIDFENKTIFEVLEHASSKPIQNCFFTESGYITALDETGKLIILHLNESVYDPLP